MTILPAALLNSLDGLPGFDKKAFENVHETGEQVTSIRINPSKHSPLIIDDSQKITWSSNGYYLPERPSFTLDPLFHAGAYYVQEASSMFLEEVLQQTCELALPLKVLDLCAAPGGKSTLIQALISDKSLLVSNEVIKTRVTVLAENITKWGASNVIVTHNDPKDFRRLENYFDVIVADAPCSGSGLFRKDPEAINEWSEQNVQLCSQRQQRILADVLPALKDGGILIYSTCSYSKEEDEDICDWLINDCHLSTIKLLLNPEWNIIETISSQHKAFGYRFYPGKVKGEGFFIAAFRKGQMSNEKGWQGKLKSKPEKISSKETAIIQPYLKNGADLFFIRQKEEVIAMPFFLESELVAIQSALYIRKAGVKLGTVIRDELIPDHELAVSTIINTALPSIETDNETALQYLRKQEIKITVSVKGRALLTHGHLPLGWIKFLPNRINNYYPKEWRILYK